MDLDRRRLLAGGLAAGLGYLLPNGSASGDDYKEEVRKRTRYLSPPDGIPADPKFGVPFRSPCAKAFTDKLFIPRIAKPEIDMTGPDWKTRTDGTPLTDEDWLAKFEESFKVKVEEFRLRGVRLGKLPVPSAHQRFHEFRPQKFYVLLEREVRRAYHSQYGTEPNCWTWCYESLCEDCSREPTSPGPRIHARYGEPILVRRINDLPEAGNHDGGAKLKFGLPSTTMHLHNAHTASESDGNPDDFINPGEYWDHHYGNFPSGFDNREKLTTLWYHDHRMDYTAANVYAGLVGFYFLFDERVDEKGTKLGPEAMQDVGSVSETEGWRLPYGTDAKYDIPLILHDILFSTEKDIPHQLVFDGYNSDGILGDQFTVNRVIRPFQAVERRKYRFRILNGGPSRFYELSMHTRRDGTHRKDTPRPDPFVLITGDGNFQPSPVVADRLHLGVAQRADFVVDFSKYQKGDKLYLVNRLLQTSGQGSTGELLDVPADDASKELIDGFFEDFSVMRFDVGDAPAAPDPSRYRLSYRPLPNVDLTEVVRERTWRFDHDGGLWTVNGRIYDGNRIDAGIEEGTAEIWTLRNEGNGWQHPIHSHFTEFIALEIDGRPQYQLDVQTGDLIHKGGSSQPALLDERHIRQVFERRLKRPFPLRGLDARLIERFDVDAKRSEQEKLVAGRQRAFSDDDARLLAESASSYYAGQEFVTFAELKAAIEAVFNTTGVKLTIDRFIGGPRRDIALLFPGTEMKVFMRWRDFRGKYVMHCHNVVHEDHAMMVRWDITPRGEGFDTPRSDQPGRERPSDRPFAEPHPGQTAAQPQTKRNEPEPRSQERPR